MNPQVTGSNRSCQLHNIPTKRQRRISLNKDRSPEVRNSGSRSTGSYRSRWCSLAATPTMSRYLTRGWIDNSAALGQRTRYVTLTHQSAHLTSLRKCQAASSKMFNLYDFGVVATNSDTGRDWKPGVGCNIHTPQTWVWGQQPLSQLLTCLQQTRKN